MLILHCSAQSQHLRISFTRDLEFVGAVWELIGSIK